LPVVLRDRSGRASRLREAWERCPCQSKNHLATLGHKAVTLVVVAGRPQCSHSVCTTALLAQVVDALAQAEAWVKSVLSVESRTGPEAVNG